MIVRSRRSLGFTLVELMVVVAIVGVLATIAIIGLRRHVFTSKVVEAQSMIQSIRVAEESWKSTHGAYLDVSGSLVNYQPDNAPGGHKRSFYTTGGAMNQRWQHLNPTIPGPVQFSYSVVAGLPGQDMPQPHFSTSARLPASAADHWYVIEAIGDADGDGVNTVCASSSVSDELVCENE